MKKRNLVVLALVLLLGLIQGCPRLPSEMQPQPRIVSPTQDGTVCGGTLITASQGQPAASPDVIRSVLFQYSADGLSWVNIWNETDLFADKRESESFGTWDAVWDASSVESGSYLLRVVMETLAGATGLSPAVSVVVSSPPVALASATQVQRGQVRFDGTGSSDADGSVVSWEWDFGDGQGGTGETVEHTYGDLTGSHPVTLIVTDDRGCVGYAHYVLSFPSEVMSFTQDTSCTCDAIAVRIKGNALGEDGKAGGKDWDKTPGMDDGKTLGPLDGNPENGMSGGEKDYTGYAFEVVCKVKGDPDKCVQIQLIKKSSSAGDKTWAGTNKDLDLDGSDDIDVSTQKKCQDAGGTWDGSRCILKFPQGGTRYGPDEYGQGEAGGAYEFWKGHPDGYPYKVHAGKQIIWYDTPSTTSSKVYKADFVAIVRGTDGKYCYVKFSVDFARQAGKDKEEIRAGPDATLDEPAGEIKGKSGAASVPGVP